MSLELQLAPGIDASGIDQDWLQRIHEALERTVQDPRLAGMVCIRICGEDESRSLNRAYRGIDKATNVLSFPADVTVPGHEVLGDLAICWPVVVREAHADDKPINDHAAHLFVHGLLHLLGMDHADAEAAEHMEFIEIQVLQRLGIANPY